MLKKTIPFIVFIGLICCKINTRIVDYFGQSEPETTPVIFAKDIISVKGRLEHGISFSPDRKELVFGILDKENFSGVIFHSKKNNGKWTMPEAFEPLKNKSAFLPYFSPDGKSMLYAQSKPDTNNGFTDIWILKKNNNFWDQPQKVNSPISTPSRESTACMTLDNTIYFSSNRNGNGLADLYCSTLENGKYLNAEQIASINTVRDEESVFASPDDTYIVFSRYATNENGPDLFITYRNINGNWIQPTRIDSSINSSDWERRPFVSIDNKFLFFTKMTFNDKGLEESDIYWVNTKKVFKPFVFNPISEMVIKIGEKTEISIPSDFFKDIDDKQLKLSFNQGALDWIEFDKETMILTMTPNQVGEFDLVFTAIDGFSNKTENKVKITVEK